MSESLGSQIVVGTTEVFSPVEGLSLKKVGRKVILNREKYLEAVRYVLSTSYIEVGRKLGVDRTTVYRFVKKHPQIKEEAEEMLLNIEDISFTRKIEIWENFLI